MPNYRNGYNYMEVPWYSQRDEIKNVVIEKGVTNIGDYAFYHAQILFLFPSLTL